MTNIGKNVAMRVDGNKLAIEVDLTQDFGKTTQSALVRAITHMGFDSPC